MSSALDQFERSLVAASRELLALDHSASTESAATTDPERPPASRRRRGSAFRRRRLMLSLAALVVAAGGVAAAQSLLWPSQRLADGTVNCFDGPYGTGISSKTLAVGDVRPNGQLPISICRRWYRINRYRFDNRPTGQLVADLPVVACQQNATTVAVYIATGQSDQCRTLGEKPLPATYAGAAARLRTLQHTLVAVQAEHDCVSPTALAKQARSVLQSQGFQRWRVITPPPNPGKGWLFGYALPTGTGGTCGTFGMGNPPTYSVVDINTHHQTVTVSVAPPRSIGLKLQHIDYELYTTTYQHCFTATSVRALVRQWFASTPLRPRFATANTSNGSTYDPQSQRLYEQGCVRFDSSIPGNNNHFVDVLLNARNASKLPARQNYPPASAFHP